MVNFRESARRLTTRSRHPDPHDAWMATATRPPLFATVHGQISSYRRTNGPGTPPGKNPYNATDENQTTNQHRRLRGLNLTTLDCQQLRGRVLVWQRRSAVTAERHQKHHPASQPDKMWDESHEVNNDAERPKLSGPAHGTQRLQPRRSRRLRCSAWLGGVIMASSLSFPIWVRRAGA